MVNRKSACEMQEPNAHNARLVLANSPELTANLRGGLGTLALFGMDNAS